MTTLTLPIVVGKKYVRRDGKVITAMASPAFGSMDESSLAFVDGPDNAPRAQTTVYKCSGLVGCGGEKLPLDLVSDYIEPAKGLTIDQFGKIEEDVCGRLCFSFFRTSGDGGGNPTLPLLDACIERLQKAKQEELDRIANLPKPDPNAENAAEYAKDMALSDKAWEGWEMRLSNSHAFGWMPCKQHPTWNADIEFRRKPV